jgi:hypothetical protein
MENAHSYDEWHFAASELDKLEGKFIWKEDARSNDYDYKRIKQELRLYRELVDRKVMSFPQFMNS